MANQDDIGQILNGCLELLCREKATVESLIERYPEYKEILLPPLEAAAWLHRKSVVFNPNPGFVFNSKRRLVDSFRKQEISVLNHSLHSLGDRLISYTKVRIRYGYGLLAFLVVIILVIGYKDVSYIFHHSIPGDVLYPLKLVDENTRLMFSFSDIGDTGLAIEFTNRRLAEIQELIILGRIESLGYALESFEDQYQITISMLRSIAENGEHAFVGLSSDLQQVLQQNYISLSTLGSLIPGDITSDFDEALSVVYTGIDTLELMDSSSSMTSLGETTPSILPFTSTIVITNTPESTSSNDIELTGPPSITPFSITPPLFNGDEDQGAKPVAKATKTPKPTHTPKPTNTHRPPPKPENDNKVEKPPKP